MDYRKIVVGMLQYLYEKRSLPFDTALRERVIYEFVASTLETFIATEVMANDEVKYPKHSQYGPRIAYLNWAQEQPELEEKNNATND